MIVKILIAIVILLFFYLVLWYFSSRFRIINETVRAKNPVWKTMGSWWPYSDQGIGFDSENLYLWATNGALAKFDQLLNRDPSNSESALSFERANYYKEELKEDNAWFGSCDKVSIASMLFEEPKHDVFINNVTFTVPMIKGLLAVIAESCVQPNSLEKVGVRFNGTHSIIVLHDGKVINDEIINVNSLQLNINSERHGLIFIKTGHTLPVNTVITKNNGNLSKDDISRIESKSVIDVTPKAFHKTLVNWIKKQRKALIIETDPMIEVWHFAYDKYKTTVTGSSNSNIKHVNTVLTGGDQTIEYTYSIKCNWFGSPLNNGIWISKPPDYLWRVQLNPNWTTLVKNPRNPYVLPQDVWSIYRLSI